MEYDHRAIEKRWQEYWEQNKTFKAVDGLDKPKFYALDMFPYPSGDGLHVGHPEGYTATDIVSRAKRMKGFNVLHPMGWDAFGLPAEQHAIKTGTHPAIKTRENVDRFRAQLKSLGFSYDWDREINTTDPGYYRWTQWIFLQLYKRDLAYIAEVPVNWCPALGTVLANEEVVDGKSERGGHEVIRKPMRQWMLKITEYAERLLSDLEELDWPESIKKMQRDWIGKSVGAEADFKLKGGPGDARIRVYTTRPDTLFGATYMVLAPEHPLVDTLTTPEQAAAVAEYKEKAARKSDLQRTDLAKEKTGVFTGGYAINPVNGAELPVWVADYVLISYGTGAIMAVPGHDTRDWEFARAMGLPIVQVIDADGVDVQKEAYVGPGTAVNSGFLDGLEADAAKEKVTAWLEEKGLGQKAVNYKLRDWLFSRQRYWGEPFPVIHTQDGGHKPVPEEQLPLRLPEVESYAPTGTGESPLAGIEEWVKTTDPETGEPARRETNTMPQWAGSCWYYLRFIDPDNDEALIDPAKEKYWMPVDLYVGGAEHAVLHLLYARFWHKVLYDAGVVSTKEPFHKLVNQGMILGFAYRYFKVKGEAGGEIYGPDRTVKVEDQGLFLKGADGKPTSIALEEAFVPIPDVVWKDEVACHPDVEGFELEVITEKMSKSRGNVINPDDVVAEYGADTLRLYEMFMGPLEQVKPWNTKGVVGLYRFLSKLWRLVVDRDGGVAASIVDEAPPEKLLKALHRTIKKVSEDTEALRFNTAIAAMMEFLNTLQKAKKAPREAVEKLILILAPYAPHICEELWRRLGHEDSLAYEPWPEHDEALCALETVTVAVQVNGKLRGKLELAPDEAKDAALAQARELENVRAWIDGKSVVREIYVPGRIVNLVVKG